MNTIWDVLEPRLGQFAVLYRAYLMGLEGSIAVCERLIRAGNHRLGRVRALESVGGMVLSLDHLLEAHDQLVRESALLGASHAGAILDDEELAQFVRTGRIEVSAVGHRDLDKARQMIAQQVTIYDSAVRRVGHELAAKKALAEGPDAFSMLDRAKRRFNSADLAVGYSRLACALAYLHAYAATTPDTKAILVHDGELQTAVSVDNLADLAGFFHPNTRYTLAPLTA